MNLRIKKSEAQLLLLWAGDARRRDAQLQIPFEKDELELLGKLRGALGKCADCGEPMDEWAKTEHQHYYGDGQKEERAAEERAALKPEVQ